MAKTSGDKLADVISFVNDTVKGADLRLGSNEYFRPRKLAFGIDTLDEILGGGLPFGRTTLIKGDFSSGKTFLVQKILQAAQRDGLLGAYIDVEKGIDPDWFTTTGVDVNEIVVAQPGSGEEALDLAVALVKAEVDVVVLDSVAALIPTVEVENDMNQQLVGSIARLLNKGLRKVTNENRNKTIFIILNQLRQGIGAAPFPTEALPGGKGQWFFSSIVLDLKKGPWIKDGSGPNEKRIGFTIKIRTEKNKLSIPQQVCELPFIFEGGVIDMTRGLFDVALDAGVIVQKGAIYHYPGFPGGKIRGKLGVLRFLEEQPQMKVTLREAINEPDHDGRSSSLEPSVGRVGI